MADAQERFQNIRLQEEYNTHDPKGFWPLALPSMKKRSKVIQIVAARNIVFALTESGVCAAFSRETIQRICFVNISSEEVIRSIFYNKLNESLVTVSVYASEKSSLRCRTTKIEYILQGKPDAGSPLFELESLKWPGFVEFDDVNGKVLTYSVQNRYKVFDLKNYTMLYSISDENVEDIKISRGTMLLIFTKTHDSIPLKIISIEDGTVLKSFTHHLHPNKKIDFIEMSNEKLLVKQENKKMQTLNVSNFDLTEVSHTEVITPSALLFLPGQQLFMLFRNQTVAVWNLQGELVTSFEDHLLYLSHPDCITNNNIYITNDEDLIISCCKTGSDEPLADGNVTSGLSPCTINVSKILTGKCIAKITATNSLPIDKISCGADSDEDNSRKSKKDSSSQTKSTVVEALKDITALIYDEEQNVIYTGNRRGLVHVWSN